MKASGTPAAEIATFASTVNDYRQLPVAGTVGHISSARAKPANDKIMELKKRGCGFGGFGETRKRLPIARILPDEVELPTTCARCLAQIEAHKAVAKEKTAAKRKRSRRKRR